MANVRIFGYRSTVQLQQSNLKHFNSDSVFVREEPYLWTSGPIALNGATPVSSGVIANDTANLVVIEIDDGTRVRYELNPNGPAATTTRVASASSPALDGVNVFQWFRGATMSFIDAAGT